ncbi:hypothetical protein S7711_03885 [Stachybotrys chartarum IBT 7711]|uniref:Inositol polyphosphate-related phosphatase domain-containing protein n=1 Tax=Stachybotrys chartarum (strain CBS 109288 / IBT 7711) TaxID=1280523 RepID=A0A084AHW3_STACB|nr:hypothetical protein S7711_03885 [Stachybotrys chartarum IBT 7711]KFA51304.1 hypothetical protein S40293_04370 [Stachybotrys chartarum IBT 40293]
MPPSSKAASVRSVISETADVSGPQSLVKAVHARRAEYVRRHRIRVKIGTWNVAACPGVDKDLASWFVFGKGLDENLATLDLSRSSALERVDKGAGDDKDQESVRMVGGHDIGLYVLGLQEVVDLNATKDYMNRAVYTDSGPVTRWQGALEAALPPGYSLVASEQMTGLLLLIYASPEVASSITNVSTKQVGTGLLGYFGNKGAVATRIVLGETTRMVFINSHLASGVTSAALERRCWDVGQVVAKTQFDPVVVGGVAEEEGDKIGDEDFAFWFGDLNYRLDGLPGGDIRHILMLHSRGEYGAAHDKSMSPLDGNGVIVSRASESDDDESATTSSILSRDESFESESSLPDPDEFPEDPSQDPTSLQATLDSLLPHDQLKRVIKQRKAFHDGWREGPITFLPSYKYDVGTVGLFDSSEKQRAPSWCDRILYRTRKDKQNHDKKIKEEEAAKKRDEELKSRGVDQDEDVLFSYDPETDGDDQDKGAADADYDEYDDNEDVEDNQVITGDGFHDSITQDAYTSHQRISSSDHKPIISVFTLDYDAVVTELKAQIHAEVARELDRVENEGRPTITLIVEGAKDSNEHVVDLGEVGFLQRKTSSLTIANTGSVAAEFSFVETPSADEGEAAMPQWVQTSFVRPVEDDGEEKLGKTVKLEPGETVLALVDAKIMAVSHVRALNDASVDIEHVLILRVESGRDYFIPVRGTWLPTSFGRSIDELIRVPDGGIRKFVKEKKIQGSIPYESDVQCSAPKQLFKLTEAIQTLAERCMADENMLEEKLIPRDVGWPFDPSSWTMAGLPEQEALRESLVTALDTDAHLLDSIPVEVTSPQRLELLSSVLLLFLESLTDGLIPAHLWAKLSTTIPNLSTLPPTGWTDARTTILDVLSSAPNHNIAFVFLTATLSRVAAELSPATPAPTKPPLITRRLSLRRAGGAAEDEAAKKRRAREKRYAELVAPLACRANGKEKGTRERERIAIEMFVNKEAAG